MFKKSYIYYGLGMGALLVVLQIIHYKAFIKDIELELFGGVIALVFLGLGLLLSTSIRKSIHLPFRIQRSDLKDGKLSSRELDVLLLLSQGYSNQEIADQLFVSLNTTKTHLANIYSKLGAKRRTQAIQRAKELHILPSPEEMKIQNHPKG